MTPDSHYIDQPRLGFCEEHLEALRHKAVEGYLAWEERLVRRMLPHWVSDVGQPVLVYNRCGRLIGLGPDVPVGEFQPVYLRTDDFDEA